VILQNAPKDKLLNVTAYLVWPALAAPVLAPVVGGFITDNFGWQWLFWVNVPLSVLAAAAAIRLAPGLTAPEAKPRLDVVGALLLAVGVCTLIPALGLSGQAGSVSRTITITIGLAALLGAVIWLRRAKSPLLDLNIFSVQTFRASNTAGALYRAVIASVPVVLTLLFQLKFGYSATLAGLVIMALFVGNLSIKPFANFLVRRRGYPFTIFWSTAVGVAVLAIFAMLDSDVSLWLLLPLLYVSGASRSIGFTAYMSMQYVDVPKAQMPQASPLSGTTQQLATAFGIAGFMGILAVSSGDYRVALIVMALVLLVSALMARRLPSTAGQAARG
jgi:MFS family permease